MALLDPTNDVMFKKLFGTEKNKHFLISFLNAILDKDIVDLEYLPVEQLPEIKDGKTTILNVKCKDKDGRLFIIEMQRRNMSAFDKRVLLYTCKTYAEHLEKGAKYDLLLPVISISILKFNLFDDRIPYLSHHVISERTTHTQTFPQLEWVVIELRKLKAKKVRTLAEQWLLFLQNADKFAKENKDEVVEEAYDVIQEFNVSKQEKEIYDAIEKFDRDEDAKLDFAREEGRAEEKVEMARKMKAMILPIETIMQLTGLTKEEIDAV